jgi:uncharacterized protein YrzB (UPF0473 family)
MEDNTLYIKTDDGKEIKCTILFTHHSDEYNKDYVVFVDDKNICSAAIYNPKDNGNGELLEIKTEEEWNMLEKLLNTYNSENEAKNEVCDSNCDNCSKKGNCDIEEDEE